MKHRFAGALASIGLFLAPGLAVAADQTPLKQSGAPAHSTTFATGDTVGVPHGGTGVTVLTTHCVVLGQGTGVVHLACPSSAGQVLTDNGASSDPTFQAPTGGVTSTGSPASGNLTKWSGSTSITNGDLSGDCSTAGTLVTVCLKLNGVSPGYFFNGADASHLTGTAPNAVIPVPTVSALGGIIALASATTHDFVTYVDTAGVQHLGRPACADLSDSGSGCSGNLSLYLPLTGGTLSGLLTLNGGAVITPECPPSATEGGFLGAPEANGTPYTGNHTLGCTAGTYSDFGQMVVMNCSSACTLTIPTNGTIAAPLGTIVPVVSIGAGAVTITPAATVNLYQAGVTFSASVVISQNSIATLIQSVANNWILTGTGGPAQVCLPDVVTSGSQASVTFSSLLSTYRDINIKVRGRTSESNVASDIVFQFNGDSTAADYPTEILYQTGSTNLSAVPTTAAGAYTGIISGANATASYEGSVDATLYDYRGTTFFKKITSNAGAPQTAATFIQMRVVHTQWTSLSAVTSIVVRPLTGGVYFIDGSVVTLCYLP